VAQRFYVETLGCPKNQVDSDKLVGTLLADGMTPTDDVALADLVVVNTCAFIDEARKESIDTILALEEQRKSGARLVVTGCMAERYGDELATALPEVDQVAGFGVPISLGRKPLEVSTAPIPMLDLLNLHMINPVLGLPFRPLLKFLTVGNQLYMAATVRDSSIGGSSVFNKFDGFLMSLKNHSSSSHPSPPCLAARTRIEPER